MNLTKLKLAALVLTMYMQSLKEQGLDLTGTRLDLCRALDDRLALAERESFAVMNRTISEDLEDLLMAIESIPEPTVLVAE